MAAHSLAPSGGNTMVERRPGLAILSHVVLMLGIAIVAFPIDLAFDRVDPPRDAILQVPEADPAGRPCTTRTTTPHRRAPTPQGARVVVVV